jgi:hypothetical protein
VSVPYHNIVSLHFRLLLCKFFTLQLEAVKVVKEVVVLKMYCNVVHHGFKSMCVLLVVLVLYVVEFFLDPFAGLVNAHAQLHLASRVTL